MLTSLIEKVPLVKGLLDFVFPPLCSGCKLHTDSEFAVCDRCLGKIEWLEKALHLPLEGEGQVELSTIDEENCLSLFACGSYGGPMRQVVAAYKFHGVLKPGGLMAQRIQIQHAAELEKYCPARLVPIPLHPVREDRRGYNQAAVLAKELQKVLPFEMADQILYRIKATRPQYKVPKFARQENIKGAFAVAPGLPAEGDELRLILVDDIVTSGHTMREAWRTLTAAGYEVVAAISIAGVI